MRPTTRTRSEATGSDAHGALFESPLLSNLSEIISRWTSHHFQTAHASRLRNGLDVTANSVLYTLGTRGAIRPSELAIYLGTGRPNVSKVVARLELMGLVASMSDPDDSRACLVSLTDAGVERSRDIFRIGDEMVREMTTDWSTREIDVFVALLERLNVASAEYERRAAAGA